MERLEQPGANELRAHPGAGIDDLDHSVGVLGTQVEKHRHALGACLDRILHEVGQCLLERLAIGQRQAGVARDDDHLVLRGVALGDVGQEIFDGNGLRSLAGRRAVPPEPRQQGLQLFRAVAQRQQHVGAKLRVVGVLLGIARQQRQLAGEVLDVVHHERDAPVELVEAERLAERVLARLFRQVARQLAADHAQQVEVLPVEATSDRGTRQHDHTDQALIVQQRHHRPGRGLIAQPFRTGRGGNALNASRSHVVEIEDEVAVLEEPLTLDAQGFGGNVDARPLPARVEPQPTFLARGQEQASGTVGDVGGRLDDPLAQRRRGRARPSHRFGEPQPFGAVVVAMLEQVLGQCDPEPAAQPSRVPHRQRDSRGERHHARLDQPVELPARISQALSEQDHHGQVGADDQQRSGAERKRARRVETQVTVVAQEADRQQRDGDEDRRDAQRDEVERELLAEVGDRRQVQVVEPDCRERCGRPAQRLARGRPGAGVEIVHQDQRPDAEQQAEDRGEPGDRLLRLRRPRVLLHDREQCELHELDEAERQHHRPDRRNALVAVVVREQAVERPQPRQMAQAEQDRGGGRRYPERDKGDRPARRQRKRARLGGRRRATFAPPRQRPPRESQREGRAQQVAELNRERSERPDHRAPSGQRMTLSVCSRISRSRKGV